MLTRACRPWERIYLISDEPYREIAYGCEVPWVPALYERTLVCYSYSKSLSLPGERIGWVLVPGTNPEHDELVPAVAGAGRKMGFVCAPALFQRVLIDCVDEPTNIEAYARNRAALTEGLSLSGLRVHRAAGRLLPVGQGARARRAGLLRALQGARDPARSQRLLWLPGLGPRELLREL